MFYIINSVFGKTFDDVRLAFPNTSFASGQPVVGFKGITPYEPTTTPDYDALRFTCREVMPVNGKQQWEIVPLSQEQIDANIAGLASSARATRNQMLTETDWTQLPDAPITNRDAWAQYRQALRDVTAQSGFPFDVQWPEQPK